MKRCMKTALCVLVAVIFLLSGCQSPSGQSTQSVAPQGGADAKLTLPFVKADSVTLTISTFDNWYTPASYSTNLPIWQEIQKRTGVTIKWDAVPDAEYETMINTRLAAGTGLPDIINDAAGSTDAYKYGSQGLLIPLESLIAQYAPDITNYFNGDGKVVGKLVTTPEGHIYSIATSRAAVVTFDPLVLGIRKDWLDKLGLSVPATTDDWYAALKAFKEKDPNGNGQADEIPLGVYSDGTNEMFMFGEAWDLHLVFSVGYWPDKDGKVQYEFIDPRMKELLTYLNKFYTEGFVDPQYPTMPYDTLAAQINQGRVGAQDDWLTMFYSNAKVEPIKQAGWPNAQYIVPNPPHASDQYKGTVETRAPTGGHWSITKDCKNPDVAIKLLDYFYANPEGILLTNYGIEGKSYTMVDGKAKLTDFVKSNKDLAWNDALFSLGALPNVPYIVQRSLYEDVNSNNPDCLARINSIQPNLVNPYPNIMPTVAESEQLAKLQTDIDTYRAEMIDKFIMGKESLDNWDAFVAKIKSLGIDDVLKIMQTQYERFSK